jgi:hypothetical protein
MSIDYPMRRFLVDPEADGGRKAEEAVARLALGDSFSPPCFPESPFVRVEECDAKPIRQLPSRMAPEFASK